jgi:hypothetical protein
MCVTRIPFDNVPLCTLGTSITINLKFSMIVPATDNDAHLDYWRHIRRLIAAWGQDL